ncbi:MAG: hypothetical protein R6W48_04785 [Gaiellaceae bacterium]
MRIAWLALLVSALLLVGAGCGGGDDEASGDADTILTETTTDDSTTDTSGTDDDVPDFVSGDCQELVAAYVAIGQAFGSTSGGSDIDEQAEIFQRFADRVPEEIRADMQTLASAYSQYADVLADAGLEPGEIPSAAQAQQLQDALQSVGSADVTAAGERVSAWTEENC